ncbi:short chain dehydrogenase family protein [Mycobacterium xenopi 3993]|nr:short chain dehydrogenase family protein [Mycobacterium xenopi 3993]
MPADASTDEGIDTVIDRARGAAGELYGLVNIAGGAAPSTWMPATRVARREWRDLFTANLETAFFMSRAVAAELKKHGKPGAIVSLSSISGMNTAPFHIAYGTAKAAVAAMTRTMALELALDNIRVNAVAPGSPRHRPPARMSTTTRSVTAAPSRWDDGGARRRSPGRSCFCCRSFPVTSPARPCWSTAASTSGGPT